MPGKLADAAKAKVDEVRTSVVEAPGKVQQKLADRTLDQVSRAQSKVVDAKQRLEDMKRK